MWQMKKILLPTDFGESSRAASEVALDLARRFQVPLVVMHCYALPASYGDVPFMPIRDYVQLLEDHARSALNQETARLRDRGVEIEMVLMAGYAWERILEAAKDLDVGMIVMGTHGRRALPRALVGSIAERVVRLSPVPVLTVRGAP